MRTAVKLQSWLLASYFVLVQFLCWGRYMEFETQNKSVALFYLALGVCNCIFKLTLILIIFVLFKLLRRDYLD